MLPEYHSDNIENYLVLFQVRLIKFSSLPGFNRPLLPVEMGDFLQKALSKTLFSFLAPMTLECVVGEWNPPE